MRLWLVTNIRLEADLGLPASAIQNLQTAAALADRGHEVLFWLETCPHEGLERLPAFLGRPLPAGLRFLAGRRRGSAGEKRTPFSTPLDRLRHAWRARRAAGGPPEAILTRSPRALSQLRDAWLLSEQTRLVLELQTPEWLQGWRGWRRKHPAAGLNACRAELRRLQHREAGWVSQADGILHASPGHARDLERAAYPGPRLWLPSGCAEPEGIPPREPARYDVGYLGMLAAANGIETLIRAVGRLPRITLLAVGRGASRYRARLGNLAREAGLAERFTLKPAVPHADVRALMRQCRVGVVALSRRAGPEYRRYASPLKLIEWMAAGVAVVGSTVQSVAGSAGGCATLVAPDDPQALADALGRLLADEASLQRQALGGLKLARERTFARRAEWIEGFVETLPAARAGARRLLRVG